MKKILVIAIVCLLGSFAAAAQKSESKRYNCR